MWKTAAEAGSSKQSRKVPVRSFIHFCCLILSDPRETWPRQFCWCVKYMEGHWKWVSRKCRSRSLPDHYPVYRRDQFDISKEEEHSGAGVACEIFVIQDYNYSHCDGEWEAFSVTGAGLVIYWVKGSVMFMFALKFALQKGQTIYNWIVPIYWILNQFGRGNWMIKN